VVIAAGLDPDHCAVKKQAAIPDGGTVDALSADARQLRLTQVAPASMSRLRSWNRSESPASARVAHAALVSKPPM